MELKDKLLMLRKEKNLSQQQLADQLNVSRQSISKWELGEGYPEVEKLILMSSLLNVSLDYLMKDTNETNLQNQEKYFCSHQEIMEYIKYKKSFALKVALAVAIIILSVIIPIQLDGSSLSTFQMLIMIAIAVGILIIAGLSSEKYKKLEKEEINMSYEDLRTLQEQYIKFQSRFRIIIVFAVCLIIVSVAIVTLLSDKSGFIEKIGITQLLLCGAISVFLFIIIGIENSMYQFLIQNHEYIIKKEEEDSSLFALTMPLAAMIYLMLGFIFEYWHPGWIIFPLTAIITMILEKYK